MLRYLSVIFSNSFLLNFRSDFLLLSLFCRDKSFCRDNISGRIFCNLENAMDSTSRSSNPAFSSGLPTSALRNPERRRSLSSAVEPEECSFCNLWKERCV